MAKRISNNLCDGKFISDRDYNRQKRELERQVVISQASGNVLLGLGNYRTIQDQRKLEDKLKAYNFSEV